MADIVTIFLFNTSSPSGGEITCYSERFQLPCTVKDIQISFGHQCHVLGVEECKPNGIRMCGARRLLQGMDALTGRYYYLLTSQHFGSRNSTRPPITDYPTDALTHTEQRNSNGSQVITSSSKGRESPACIYPSQTTTGTVESSQMEVDKSHIESEGAIFFREFLEQNDTHVSRWLSTLLSISRYAAAPKDSKEISLNGAYEFINYMSSDISRYVGSSSYEIAAEYKKFSSDAESLEQQNFDELFVNIIVGSLSCFGESEFPNDYDTTSANLEGVEESRSRESVAKFLCPGQYFMKDDELPHSLGRWLCDFSKGTLFIFTHQPLDNLNEIGEVALDQNCKKTHIIAELGERRSIKEEMLGWILGQSFPQVNVEDFTQLATEREKQEKINAIEEVVGVDTRTLCVLTSHCLLGLEDAVLETIVEFCRYSVGTRVVIVGWNSLRLRMLEKGDLLSNSTCFNIINRK